MANRKQELIKDLLIIRKREVETYRANHTYGEWQCGQSDADADEAEYYDKTMRNAIGITDKTIDIVYNQNITKYEVEEALELIKEVTDDFRMSVKHMFNLQ